MKKAYYQGTEEPKPGKQQYKPEKAIVVEPRFKTPFFKNYDAYETSGTDEKENNGPGAGWHDMDKYKSIKDFLKNKRKLKDKYKSEDHYTKTTSKKKARQKLLLSIIKHAIDFPIDNQVEPILNEYGTYSGGNQLGGLYDVYLAQPDFEGKSVDQLNHGYDYTENYEPNQDIKNIEDLLELYLHPKEPPLHGLPDGLEQQETENEYEKNPSYGETDSGNTLYDKIEY